METTLIILKPDAVQRGLIGSVVQRFERKGLQIVGMKFLLVPRSLAEKHYAVHAGKPFFNSLIQFITSSPVVVMAIRGPKAIEVCRRLIGPTDGTEAPPGTIRGDFGVSKSLNLIHGSDGPDTAKVELALWFQPEELAHWDRAVQPWLTD